MNAREKANLAFRRLVENVGGAHCAAHLCAEHGVLSLREKRAFPAFLTAVDVPDNPFVIVLVRDSAQSEAGFALSLTEATARRLGAGLIDCANRLAARRENGGRA